MKLNYKKLGEGAKSLFIVHGLFGSLDNWITLGKRFAEDYTVYLVDQRNHGKSPHDPIHDYKSMADDLDELRRDLGLTTYDLIGHSMGGKMAMELVTREGSGVDKVVIVDIGPKYYLPHHEKIIAGLDAVDPATLTSRNDGVARLAPFVQEMGTQQFLLKNLTREGNGFAWKMNYQDIKAQIENIGEGLPEDRKFEGSILFVRGGNSDYILSEDRALIKHHFPKARVVGIQNAGHWIHAEQPEAFYQTVIQFLRA